MLSKDMTGCVIGSWMVQRLGHEDSPVEMFGIFRLGWEAVRLFDEAALQRRWIMVDYTLTQDQAFAKVKELAPLNAEIHWRI